MVASSSDEKYLNESAEYKCLLQAFTSGHSLEEIVGGCPIVFDSVLCWPQTPPATLAVLPCFKEFQGLKYDSTKNATRFCLLDGIWDNYTNYDQCQLLDEPVSVPEFEAVIELPTFIYGSGYILSLISLSLALTVFIYFKDLRCLRNTIHANLFLTYILSAILWILTLSLQITSVTGTATCIYLVILFQYFSLTIFFWMLVEGLYLYMLVVETFSGDNLKFRMYAFIGWGVPAIIVGIWAIVRSLLPILNIEQKISLQIECPWMIESYIDWIYQGPSCACLVINLFFLIRIMWVLIIKLRSANTNEARQYRKASKALLVLIPLFGITYLIILAGPSEGVSSYIFAVARALLISTQGFSVSLLYCFLNSEVKLALRQRFRRWQDERNIRSGTSSDKRYKYRSSNSREYSPRSGTESLRLTSTSPMS